MTQRRLFERPSVGGEATAKQFVSTLHRVLPAICDYWLHNTLRSCTIDTLPSVLQIMATAPVRLRIDQRCLYLLEADWAHVPLALCGGVACRLLHTMLRTDPCSFRVHIDTRTYHLEYNHFAYNGIVDNRLRREALVGAFLRAALKLFHAKRERAAACALFAATCETCAKSHVFSTHPLRRALLSLAATIKEK